MGPAFREANLYRTPIRDLGLSIENTPLAPVIDQFRGEITRLGIRLAPRFYLSTEWGVPFGTIAIAIPFYLARPELADLHSEHVGHIEGHSRNDILRYLRHELGHVINYAYRLYDEEAWVKLFGSMTQPYLEDYRPQPFSRRYVRHLPGWYAQKHPDEDWAESFAVWMTPERDWRQEYAHLPTVLAKLNYCAQTMERLRKLDPLVVATDLDEDVGQLAMSLGEFYRETPGEETSPGLDGDLRAIFTDIVELGDQAATRQLLPAGALIRRLERPLMADVFRWTGHFPERVRALVRHLAKRADLLEQVYPAEAETQAIISVTTLVTSLAMNFVHRGAYFPEAQSNIPGDAQKADRDAFPSNSTSAATG